VATISKPMTFAEFEKLPDCEFRLELRHGQTVEMPPAIHRHKFTQQRLSRLLSASAGSAGEIVIEMGFRIGEQNYRVADLAFVSRQLWDAIPQEGYLDRAPELVVEVLSPSNTAVEMREKRKLCLENGSREFWVVDPAQREVEISTPDGRSVIYQSGQQIPLFFAGERTLAVDAVFE
jgi:Uma2 family endonuclease